MNSIYVDTWTVVGADSSTATWLREKVAHNGGRVAVENGRVIIDEAAVALLRELNPEEDDGAVEPSVEGLVMYAAGDVYPLHSAGQRGLHFHESR